MIGENDPPDDGGRLVQGRKPYGSIANKPASLDSLIDVTKNESNTSNDDSNKKFAELNGGSDEEIGSIESLKLWRKFFPVGNAAETQQRLLQSRHMMMLSLGGAIGTGIFLSSGQAIAISGPGSALMAYLVIAVFVFGVVVMLGEMCAAIPISGAFGTFGGRFIDQSFGFALGLNYYLQWAFTIPSEITACAIIIQFWLPHIQAWIWAIVIIVPLFMIQLLNVKFYGEIEYWSSWIKVLLVIIFIFVGLLFDWNAIPTAKVKSPGLSNWKNNQAFIGGFSAFVQSTVYAFYSYGGAELISLTSGEAANPQKTIPKSIRLTFIRVLLFNVFSILVIGLCINHKDARLLNSAFSSDVSQSPFTVVFEEAGFGPAVHLVNAVLLTAVLSALNSAYYASTRMTFSMAKQGLFPQCFSYCNKKGVPFLAVVITLIIACLSFLTTIWGAGVAFSWLQNLVSITAIITWTSTGFINLRFRQAIKSQGKSVSDLPFRQPFYPLFPILTIFLGIFLFVAQGYASTQWGGPKWKNILATYIGIVTFLVSFFGYQLKQKRRCHFLKPSECNLISGSIWDVENRDLLKIPTSESENSLDDLHGASRRRKIIRRIRKVLSNI